MDLLMFVILAIVLVFAGTVLRTILHWKGVWRWIASLPLVVLALGVLDIVNNPRSHNLWPFELIALVVLGFIILGVVATIRSRFVKGPKEGH